MDFKDVEAAAKRLDGVVTRTGLLSSVELDRITGGQIFIKPECLQKTGSFKLRGAYNRLVQIADEDRHKGVVAFSSGNHAQGVALAANLLNIPAIILMPNDAPKIKIERTRSHGAEVVLFDRVHENREEMGAEIAKAKGAVLVPPYDDQHIIAGQGTCGLEVMQDMAAKNINLHSFLAPASGGGLLAGSALAVKHFSPKTDVYSVEPNFFDDHARSLKRGARVGNDKGAGTSICDALQVEIPGEHTFAVNSALVKAGLSVSDDETIEAMRFAFNYLNIVVEPSGAVALAAVLCGKIETENKNIALVISGGNVDAGYMMSLVNSGV